MPIIKNIDEIGNLKIYTLMKKFFSNDREFLIRMVLNGKKLCYENILYYMQSHKILHRK